MLLAPAGVALLSGVDAALILLGLPAPVTAERLPEVHGMLMVLGFLGTLVALERAVALARRAGYVSPALLGLGGLLLLGPLPLVVGRYVLVAGAAALVGLYVPLWRRQRDDAVLVQALGAVAAVGAAVLWLGGVPVATLLPWLVGFVVLTIAGERLELARIGMGASAGPVLVALASALLAAIVAALLWATAGTALLGLVLVGLTGWLATHDVARRTVRTTGLPRYTAWCLLAGYAWLAVAGAVWLVGGPAAEGVRYDAVVHATFLGFAISMVMAHAPVILPAVLRRPLPYHPALYAPVCLLHGSLALRLWVGDALGSQAAWVTGGVLNIAALLSFAAVAAWSASTAADPRRVRTHP
ncbi:hypothetical protein KWG65_09765 [Nocardioides daeguensis]|nr:hypothetical protein [Nocardioides daeguensis]MCR1773070.1 hypothetical protein [Nocardioides daeguensis]